jgi:PKD repeat protein
MKSLVDYFFNKPLYFTIITTILLAQSVFCQIFTQMPIPENPDNSSGCAWIDYNNDKNPDIFLSFFSSNCRLFTYNGNWEQVDSSSIIPTGNNYSGVSWGDYDNDGYGDLFITSMNGDNILYNNFGGKAFNNITYSGTTGIDGVYISSNWVDYDNDGNLDLFIPGISGLLFTNVSGSKNLLFKNNGDGSFTRNTDDPLADAFGNHDCAVFSDYDNDGDQDAFMTEWGKNNWLFENNGNGSFTSITGSPVNSNSSITITASWGDYNNDGFMDLFVGNGSTDSTEKQLSYLYKNNGDKTFTKVTSGAIAENLACVWTSAWGDVDNDGDIDLYAGTIYDQEELLYINNGDGTFTQNHELNVIPGGTSITGASFGDYDNDGALDLMLADASTSRRPFIYHNNGNNNNWLMVSCSGVMSNRSAIGARVKVKAEISGKSYWQIRDITGNQGFRGSNDLRAHFGIGDAAIIDSLIIEWPSKSKSVMTNVNVNQILEITEDVPDGYMKLGFKSDVITGYSPLEVNFMNYSIYDENLPVSWSWDLDGDGKEDSKEKNPVFTYNTNSLKEYKVSLTVVNGDKTVTLEREGMIKVLPLSMKNLAVLRKVTASSKKNASFAETRAVDGNTSTVWQSAASDSQWIQVELDSLIEIGRVSINWGAYYGLKYKILASEDNNTWKELANIQNGAGNTEEYTFTSVKAKFVKISAELSFYTGRGYNIREFEVFAPAITSVPATGNVPSKYELLQNYPNPFNPATTIGFHIGQGGGFVNLKLYDVLGKEILTLVNEEKQEGEYKIKMDGRSLPSGVYFYTIRVNDFLSTKKMILLK